MARRGWPRADLLACLAADEEDGDERDERFRQSGADGGKDAPDSSFSEVIALSQPLDGVGEELAAGQDDDEADQEQ
jgi:hypothetical protein